MMSSGDSPFKVMIISLVVLVVLVILVATFFLMLGDPSGFYRDVEYWIEKNL